MTAAGSPEKFSPQTDAARCLHNIERFRHLPQETQTMKQPGHTPPLTATASRTSGGHRNLILTIIGMLTLLMACVPASYTNDSASAGATDAGGTVATQSAYTGQWLAEFRTGEERVQLSFRYNIRGEGFNDSSNTSFRIAPDQLQGLTREQAMSSAGGRVQFQLKRDAGTLYCEGWFKNGQGSGHFTFSANPAYTAELRRQGYSSPTAEQQFSMALHDVSFAFIEELKAQNYPRPTLDQLVETGTHGVSLEYLRGLKALGYVLRSVESLIEMRDHGVSLNFINELAALGYERLTAEQLVETKDHGVNPDFVREFEAAGYGRLPLAELIELKDHGVSTGFVRELAALGYNKLATAQLREMKDHGVDPGFIREIKQLGYADVTVDQLIRLRDHGVTASFIQKMRSRGHQNLTLDQLIDLRDRGDEG
jgi:hypothetical protein